MTKLEAAVKQLVNRAAGGDQRAAQFVLALLPADHGRPAREEPKRIGKNDSLVVAEIIRRFSRPPAPSPAKARGRIGKTATQHERTPCGAAISWPRPVLRARKLVYPAPEPTSLAHWLLMQAAIIAGFGTTYPVNRL